MSTIPEKTAERKPSKKSTPRDRALDVARTTVAEPPVIHEHDGADDAARERPVMHEVLVSQIATSAFNVPHRDPDAELLASVRERGVFEPVMVRPLRPGRRVEDSLGERLALFELVFGERRWKASVATGKPTIPAIIRELTDAQALDLQAEENLQRKDLSPVQEGAVYAQYRALGLDETAIAARVHRTVRHVVQRLLLTTLLDEEKKALEEGRILLATAIELACLPKSLSASEREAALDLVMSLDGSVMSAREARGALTRRFYLKMANAPFPAEDASLVPSAGACIACPKRTGSQLALSIEGLDESDRCGDAACWKTKADAYWARTAQEAARKGAKVIDGLDGQKGTKEAHDALRATWLGASVNLDDPCHALSDPELEAASAALEEAEEQGTEQEVEALQKRVDELEKRPVPTWRDVLGAAVAPHTVVREKTDDGTKLVELVDRKKALEVLDAKGVLSADARHERDDAGPKGEKGEQKKPSDVRKDAAIERRAEEILSARLRQVLVDHAEATPPRPTIVFWRSLIAAALHNLPWHGDLRSMFAARGWEGFDDIAADDIFDAVMTRANHLSEPKLRGLLVDVMAANTDTDARDAMLEPLMVDQPALKAEAEKAAREEAAAPAPNKTEEKTPPKKKGAKKGVTTADAGAVS